MPKKKGFRAKWLSEPKWSWLCSTTKDEEGWCLLCKQTLSVKYGASSLYSHASTRKHKNAVNFDVSKKRTAIDIYKEELCHSISQLFSNNNMRPIVKVENLSRNYERFGQSTSSSPSTSAEFSSSSSPNTSAEMNTSSEESSTAGQGNGSSPSIPSCSCTVGQHSSPCLPSGNEDKTSISREIQIQIFKKEISVLKKCMNEKALLCESTGNLEFIKESNVLRKIAEEKSQLLKNLKQNME